MAKKSGETVEEWSARWLSVSKRERSARTRGHHQERVRSFVAAFGDRPLESLTADELGDWFADRMGSLSSVKSMLNDAVDAGVIGVNPAAKVKTERREERVDILSPDDLVQLLQAARRALGPYGKVVYAPMLEVAAWTGLDPSELYALAPEDLLWDEDALVPSHVLVARTEERAPNANARQVALLPGAAAALDELGVRDLPGGDAIFKTAQGRRFTQRAQSYYWTQVRDELLRALPEDHWLRRRPRQLVLNDLQHFFGAQLAERGVTPQDIAEMLGHKDGGRLAALRYTGPAREAAKDRVLEAFRRAA